MATEITEKLRTEINDSKKMRHDFVIRKFTLITTLLGFAAFDAGKLTGIQIHLFFLAYLVPIVAVAFDFYIIAEDHRIKRAGTFIQQGGEGITSPEEAWEFFVKRNPTHKAIFAFCFVTSLYLLGSTMVLWSSQPLSSLVLWWACIISIEAYLVISNITLRDKLENQSSNSTPINTKKIPSFNQKITKFIVKLNKATSETKILWRVAPSPSSMTTAEPERHQPCFTIEYSGQTFKLSRNRLTERVTLEFFDAQGQVLWEEESQQSALSDLFDTVRRKLSNIDAIIDAVLSNDDEPSPPLPH